MQEKSQGRGASTIVSSPVLIIPTAGQVLIVDGNGKQWVKAMTPDDLAYLAERCLAAARETK